MSFEPFLNFIVNMSGPLLILFVLLFFQNLIDRKEKNRKEALRRSFNEKVIDALNSQHLRDTKHIKRIYASVVNTNYTQMERWVAELLTEFYNYENFSEEHYQILEKILDDIEFEEPFSGLPEDERNLLKDINEYKDKNSDMFKEKLHRLGNIIKTRYEKEANFSKWNKFLTILSVLLGIIGAVK